MTSNELPFLDPDAQEITTTPARLSPSEEFRLAHPDFTEPVVEVEEWDPNARRAAQVEGAGGGIKQAIDGTLHMTAESEKEKAMQAARELAARAREKAAEQGRSIPTPEQAAANSRQAASDFLDSRLPKSKK